MATHRVAVVGAGIGGLTAALLLACRGLEVTVVEKAAAPGGKMRQVSAGGAAMDAGPTVFTMRWVFEEIAAAAGSRLESLVRLHPQDILARHAWAQGGQLDLHADPARSSEAVARFAGPDEARRFEAFCARARRVYQTLEGPYIRGPRPSLGSLGLALGPRGLGVLAGLGPFRTLWSELGRHFHDPRLRQLFARYATYCGSSPFLAPATLVLVAQVEMDGVWRVEGGMHALARAVADLAQARGARLRFGRGCARILVRGGRAAGLHLDDGEELPADSVIFNGDAAALQAGLLGPDVRGATPGLPASRSLSAMVWNLRAATSGFPLAHHNVFFDRTYAPEFEDIFGASRLPRTPTVYVCAQDRDDRQATPADRERLLVLVNAPPTGDGASPSHEEMDRCQQRSFALMRECGLNLEDPDSTATLTTPREFEALFPATGGSLYGSPSHGWMASFRRPGARTALPGLYLAGGSAHPGPGVPMAALSGRLAAATLMEHLDSTSR